MKNLSKQQPNLAFCIVGVSFSFVRKLHVLWWHTTLFPSICEFWYGAFDRAILIFSIIVSASWIHMIIWACVITLSIHHLFTMSLPYLSITVTDKLKERLDFMLRESLTENSYINSLTAHTAYWTSQDCAMYVLLQIYKYKRYEWTGMLQRTCSMCFFVTTSINVLQKQKH